MVCQRSTNPCAKTKILQAAVLTKSRMKAYEVELDVRSRFGRLALARQI